MKVSLGAELPSMAASHEGHESLLKLLTIGSLIMDHTRHMRQTSPIILSPELFLGSNRPRTGSSCQGHVQHSPIIMKSDAREDNASSGSRSRSVGESLSRPLPDLGFIRRSAVRMSPTSISGRSPGKVASLILLKVFVILSIEMSCVDVHSLCQCAALWSIKYIG